MIDIHSHILPGVDDGAESLEDSLAMARAAVEEGISVLLATPHHANGRYLNEGGQVRQAVDALQAALDEADIPLKLCAGQEIRVYKELLEDYHEGKLLTLADSRYILLEFPTSRVPEDIYEMLHELGVLGLIPVIAHPERNMELAKHPERLAELIERGALAQMTTHSLNGLFGRKIQDIAFTMCESNLIHFLAGDAHNPAERAFGMEEACSGVRKKLGESFVDYYKKNADIVINNGIILPQTPKVRKKKRFQFW